MYKFRKPTLRLAVDLKEYKKSRINEKNNIKKTNNEFHLFRNRREKCQKTYINNNFIFEMQTMKPSKCFHFCELSLRLYSILFYL